MRIRSLETVLFHAKRQIDFTKLTSLFAVSQTRLKNPSVGVANLWLRA
jgi:hypothetical protein